jgi:hypothetical protein
MFLASAKFVMKPNFVRNPENLSENIAEMDDNTPIELHINDKFYKFIQESKYQLEPGAAAAPSRRQSWHF